MTVKSSMPISEAESIVMQVFWERGALPSEDVVSALKSHGKWQESTVKTLLNRLLKKGALRARKHPSSPHSTVIASSGRIRNSSRSKRLDVCDRPALGPGRQKFGECVG